MGLNNYFVEQYTWFNEPSFFNAIAFSSIFALLLCLACRKTSWMERMGLQPFSLFVLLSIVRLILPIQLPFSQIVGSWTVLPTIQDFFQFSLFHWQGHNVSVFYVLVVAWVAGTVILLTRFIWQWVCYIRRTSKYLKAPEEMMEDLKMWIPDFQGQVCFVEEDSVPHFSGFFRPVIFLPMVDYKIQDLRLIFLHEWQHFRNHDQWSKLFCYLLCCLFWWNPLIWLLKSKMDQLLELRCDRAVLSKLSKEEQVAYYAMLLEVYQSIKKQKHSKPEGIPALASAHSHSIVLQRFQMGRSFSQMKKQSKALSIAFSAVLIVAFCVSYGVIFQPRELYLPEEGSAKNEGEVYINFPEGSYLTPNADGSYTLHCNGEEMIVQDITEGPVASLPIVE